MNVPLPLDRYFAYVIAIEAECMLRELAENPQHDLPPPITFHRGMDPSLELSIVIPAWNPKPAHFVRCLESLANADLAGISFEVLVGDDASSNDSVKQSIEHSRLPRIGYHRHAANLGGFGNFNWCIGAARGAWIHLLHQDDWIEPTFYHELLRGPAAECGAELRYCRTKLFYEESGQTRLMFDEAPTAGIIKDFLQRQCSSQRIQISGAIMARSALEQLGGYDPTLGTGGDWEFWARWAHRFPVFYSPKLLATFSLHSESWASREESLGAHRPVLRRILGYVPCEHRRRVATAFIANLVSRLVGIATGNRRANSAHLNRAIIDSLLVGCRDAGITMEVEKVLAALPLK